MNLNQRDISKSYFINKSTVKNNVKQYLEVIKYFENYINLIKEINENIIQSYDPYYTDPRDNHNIKIAEELIRKAKEKIKKETNIYFY